MPDCECDIKYLCITRKQVGEVTENNAPNCDVARCDPRAAYCPYKAEEVRKLNASLRF